jgi:hypothetical protein
MATVDVVGEWRERKRRRGNKIFDEDEPDKKRKWKREKNPMFLFLFYQV